jgi:predicted nucleotidyltransferase
MLSSGGESNTQGKAQMLSAGDRSIAQALKARVRQVAPVRSVRVYGSRARGDAAPDSDLDVYIELESISPALRQQISEIAWEVGFARNVVISTFVVTRDQLDNGPIGASPLIANVMREGIAV